MSFESRYLRSRCFLYRYRSKLSIVFVYRYPRRSKIKVSFVFYFSFSRDYHMYKICVPSVSLIYVLYLS